MNIDKDMDTYSVLSANAFTQIHGVMIAIGRAEDKIKYG